MAAARETPLVSACRCRSAPGGSVNPNSSSRSWAASGVSRNDSVGTRATASSSGRYSSLACSRRTWAPTATQSARNAATASPR